MCRRAESDCDEGVRGDSQRGWEWAREQVRRDALAA